MGRVRAPLPSPALLVTLQKQIVFTQALPMQLDKEIHSTVQETLAYAPH